MSLFSLLFRANSCHQPDVCSGCSRVPRSPFYKWILAFHYLKTGSFDFLARQIRGDLVKLELVCPRMGAVLCTAVVCDDEAASRFQGMKDLVQHSLVVRKVMV